MKILIHSNAPWAATGYGKQTKLFAPRIAALGHDVAISAFHGLEGGRLTMADGIRIYPRSLDAYGNDVLEMHARDFFGSERDGLVMPLTDIWVIDSGVLSRLHNAAWVPVDHEPCQPPTVTTLRTGRSIPIAMSRFGERMLKDEGFDPVYVPHGYDGSVFAPLDQRECRAALEIPQGGFVVGMVAANQGFRKSFPQSIRAFAAFHERHPDSFLLLHTWLGPQRQGVDLHDLLEQHLPADSVLVCDQYRYAMGLYPDEYLAQVYSSIDCLLNVAQGEGFGVCQVEAQACGTPVISTDATAMPELCGSGYLVGGEPIYTNFSSWQLLPSIEEIEAALEASYAQSAQERLESRQRARDFAIAYDADRVAAEYWPPALAEIERRMALRRWPKDKKKRGA